MTRTVVGLVYHSRSADLATCLESLRGSADAKIVVLDVSPDGSAREEVAKHPGVVWAEGSRNAGYAWGLHQIADGWLEPGDVFVGANSDIQLLSETLENIVRHATELGGVCFPLQLDESGSPAAYNLLPQLSLSGSIARWLMIGRRRIRRKLDPVIAEAAKSNGAVPIPRGVSGSGAMMAMTQAVWQRTGGLDSQYFLFCEDSSFGTSAELSGISSYLCGDSPIVHEGGFRGRGVTAAGTVECLASEQLNWRAAMNSPAAVVVLIQVLGLVLRISACAFSGRKELRLAYSDSLRFRLRRLSASSAAPFGADGYRLPAMSSLESSETGSLQGSQAPNHY